MATTAELLDLVNTQIAALLASPVEEYRSGGSAAHNTVRRRSLAELRALRAELRAELAAQNNTAFTVADVREG